MMGLLKLIWLFRYLLCTEDLKLDVASAQKLVENGRLPLPYPKEPVFPDFPPIPFVLALPTAGSNVVSLRSRSLCIHI